MQFFNYKPPEVNPIAEHFAVTLGTLTSAQQMLTRRMQINEFTFLLAQVNDITIVLGVISPNAAYIDILKQIKKRFSTLNIENITSEQLDQLMQTYFSFTLS